MPAGGTIDDAVRRMCAGDGDAFREVYRSTQPALLRYLTVLVGTADAEDVASETWAQACRDLGRFSGDADGFRGWVTTIGRHRALDLLRQRSRRVRVDRDLTDIEVADPRDLEATVEEAFGTAGAVALIGSLPRQQAEAVWLRVVMGLDAKTAASVMGTRPGAVRSSTSRGLKTLARLLESRTGSTTAQRDIRVASGAEGVR
ncbi:RNA polymerase sigma factor [Nocardioides cynanchi]|uniref:RNA polymerase sigma factor n=1 Tax=Nocardioides cynanchi TaxID=2558918 RepID=UPI00192D1D9D|nr:sigma-70 family RNA polymerase sigma factor [Nocardioides cynanchi]